MTNTEELFFFMPMPNSKLNTVIIACIFHSCDTGLILSMMAWVMLNCMCIPCCVKEAHNRMTGKWKEVGELERRLHLKIYSRHTRF